MNLLLKSWITKLLFLFLIIPNSCFSKQINTFSEAKKQARLIWAEHRVTVYCDCQFDKQLRVNFKTCSYIPQDKRRAKRVEWEHIVPVSSFGQSRACWKKELCTHQNGKKYKGRNCCEKTDLEFREMYTDLHNLIPIIGEVNGARSNYSFTHIPIFKKLLLGEFNGCEIFIDPLERIVEPRDEIKGLVARAHLYMANTYGLALKPEQEKIMQEWHLKYPPSEWEKKWNAKIFKLTGKNNCYIQE